MAYLSLTTDTNPACRARLLANRLKVLRTHLTVGMAVPPLTLFNRSGTMVRSTELVSQGPLILVFHASTGGVCESLELLKLEQRLELVHRLGAELVVVAPDQGELCPLERHGRSVLPLYWDLSNQAAASLGLVWTVPVDWQSTCEQVGLSTTVQRIWQDHQWIEQCVLAIHGVFVLDQRHHLLYALVDPGHRQRLDMGRCLASVDADYWLAEI